jgi:hypothetical protein
VNRFVIDHGDADPRARETTGLNDVPDRRAQQFDVNFGGGDVSGDFNSNHVSH